MSDDDSDDDLLGYKPITASASLSGKRERVPTKRLVEEVADVDSCSDEDCDLKKLAAKSARAAKRAQKLGFSTDAEYRAQAMVIAHKYIFANSCRLKQVLRCCYCLPHAIFSFLPRRHPKHWTGITSTANVTSFCKLAQTTPTARKPSISHTFKYKYSQPYFCVFLHCVFTSSSWVSVCVIEIATTGTF